jgi:hypothetical protein
MKLGQKLKSCSDLYQSFILHTLISLCKEFCVSLVLKWHRAKIELVLVLCFSEANLYTYTIGNSCSAFVTYNNYIYLYQICVEYVLKIIFFCFVCSLNKGSCRKCVFSCRYLIVDGKGNLKINIHFLLE